MDDDTLPVIDLDDDEDEPGAAAMPAPAPAVEVPPVPWHRRRSPRWVRRTAVAMLLATVGAATLAGGKAWSTMDRGVAVYTGPRAGDFADRLRCAGDPRVKNDFDFYGTAPLPGERSLPTPPWLRDRSFGATATRTAHDAARWLNANTDAAATFRKTDIAAWDRATVLQLARAEEWMRSWRSRHGKTAPPGWTEDAAVAALRQAVRDDRFLTEDLARTVKGTLRWRPVSPPPGRESADAAAVGGFRGIQLMEVLVYRRGAGGLLRVRGRAYCDEVDEPDRSHGAVGAVGAGGAEVASRPAGPAVQLSCTAGRFEPDGVLTDGHGGPGPPPRPPDGHTTPRRPPGQLPAGVTALTAPEPAMAPAEAIAQYRERDYWRAGTVGASLDYEVVWASSTDAVAVGRHGGHVKLIVDLRRRVGGWWSAETRDSCVRDLHATV